MMKNRLFFFPALLFLILFLPVLSVSHPHVFMTNRLVFVFDDAGLAGVRVKWSFDEFFSSMISTDYDINKNGVLEKNEINTIKKEAFSYLAEYEYFTFIKIDGKPFDVKYVQNFSASLAETRLFYDFFIPCHVKASASCKKITICQYDSTYYSVIFFSKNLPVSIQGGSGFEKKYTIAENPNDSYYFGQIHPVEAILKFRIKND